jgi:hypothetical protein
MVFSEEKYVNAARQAVMCWMMSALNGWGGSFPEHCGIFRMTLGLLWTNMVG